MSMINHPASSDPHHKWNGGADDDEQDQLQWNNDQPPFGPDDPPPSAFWGHDPMTRLDTTAFAKGGKNSGGGTSGGGGTGTTDPSIVGTYFAGAADGEAGYDIRIDFKGTGWTDAL